MAGKNKGGCKYKKEVFHVDFLFWKNAINENLAVNTKNGLTSAQKSLFSPAIPRMHTRRWQFHLGTALLFGALSLFAADMPKPGSAAPAIVGRDQDGHEWAMADLMEQECTKGVLLYFYPKDDTPGCTKQACAWRDQMEVLKKHGIRVVGVSFDTAESHRRFIKKHKLNFTLLADPKGKLADVFGVRIPGRQLARRVSFLIDMDSKVHHVVDHHNTDVHLREIKAAFARLVP
jgi:peroxiredoxin Q/BCP